MDCFQYPLDTKTLLRKKRSIKKELLQQHTNWIKKKVAILGGSTTNEVADQLELFLLHYGIKAEFYQSEYGQYYEDALFGSPELDDFAPDIIFFHTSWRNVAVFPTVSCSKPEVDNMLDVEFERYSSMWQSVREKFQCVIIQNNFDRPDYRVLGNRDVWDYRGRSNYISRLNQKLYEYAVDNESFFINDIDYIAGDYGYSAWNDDIYWNMYKYICPLPAVPHLAQSVAFIIKSIYGKNKKLIALDLDNTLWGGVVGDDSVEGIKIGKEVPSGQAYYAFQSYIRELKQIGIVLAVDSKNDEENALAGLAHPDSVLHEDDFVTIKANWQPKDQNLREIANELSLGADSFVFIDDNPAEREIVKKQLPEVATPKIDAPENYVRIIDHSGYFEVTTLSSEDMEKTDQYRARASANASSASFENYEEYLESLEMKAVVTEFEPISVQRIAQLTNKTNQFNLTTMRCTEEDIRAMQNNPNYICMCGRLIDKFGDNGIVTVIAGEILGNEIHIRLWLMSCRVLKRGLEDFMMNVLVKKVKAKGLQKIIGYYIPTSKNSMVRCFFEGYGFEPKCEDANEEKVYTLSIDKYSMHDTKINVV